MLPHKRYFFLMLLIAATSCTQKSLDNTPTKVLESYIQISFNASSLADKHHMEELLTGDTKQRLVSWSDEQFMKVFVDAKKKFQGLKILENKKVSDTETALTYEIAYQDGYPDKTAQVTQRKLCTVVSQDGNWRIKEVRSLRESIEYLKELSLP